MTVTACNDVTLRSISELLADVGSPLALNVVAALKSGDHLSVLGLTPDTESPTFRDDYLASEILSKYPYLDLKLDRKAVALSKFKEIEESLVSSDRNLKRCWSTLGQTRADVHWVFHSMIRKIQYLLSDFNWGVCETFFGFGPGATVSLPRTRAYAPNKFGNLKPTVTQSCLDLAIAAVRSNPSWADHLGSHYGQDPFLWFTIVAGNKVVTVPKSAKTDRTIAIEPDLNMYLQKGIGGVLRRKLARVGVDLSSQLLNQQLAKEGSVSGTLATVDLSAASDSVSMHVIEMFLPPDWVDAIKATRSPCGRLPSGELITYQKVSSMGNGFTFELETLLFWAAVSSCIEYLEPMDRRFAVYGDDLIISVDCVDLLLDVLGYLGFTPNAKKTFYSGSFRESCGKHFSKGDDVTPIYLREKIETLDRKIWWLNSLSRWSTCFNGLARDDIVKPSWDRCFNSIPVSDRPLGPLYVSGQLSGTCIGVPFDTALPVLRRSRHGLDGFLYRARVEVSERGTSNSIGSLILFLDRYGRDPSRPRCEPSSIPGRRRWRTIWSFTPQWQEAAPWFTTRG